MGSYRQKFVALTLLVIVASMGGCSYGNVGTAYTDPDGNHYRDVHVTATWAASCTGSCLAK